MKKLLIKLHWFLSDQFGLDPRRLFRALLGIPRFAGDWLRFRRGYAGPLSVVPCLHDWHEEGGATKNEYFWQDLLVARWIFEANPKRHVDVGSRVDGFVAHVASYRKIEVFDVRPITAQIPNIEFKQADLMSADRLPVADGGYCDSLSCLHALEHFGLGRYGDPVDPVGYERGIANMAQMLKPGGTFYLSTPIGRERVEFNANRIFNPLSIVSIAERNCLELRRLTVIAEGGAVRDVHLAGEALQSFSETAYILGVFVFTKS